jgi:hypothetical protein
MSNEVKVYNVKNRSAGMVVYRIPEQGVRRVFQPGEIKRISHAELEALSFRPGGKEIISQYLQVRNVEVLNELNITTEPEYFMDQEQVIELIKTGTLDQWIDALNFAPAGVIELIKKLSVELPVADYNKRQVLKEKLNFDVDAAIKNKVAAEAEEETITPVGPTRRSSTAIVDKNAMAEATAAAPVRTTETPGYKIISEG